MITKEQFIEDDRFFVNSDDVDRIFKNKIKKYKICKYKIGNIKKKINKKIISIYETESYKLLNDEINSDEYSQYCKNETFKYEGHSLKSYNSLIEQFKEYSLNEGAIVVDQFGLIRDGQHRTSILLKKYDKDYKISVVKVYYAGFRIKTYILLALYMLRKGKNAKFIKKV